ncbi:MAG: hypothetical protein NTV08_00255 [Verrucomicrobia bacterium]|nr:hypothetical protein [Verrucomicrobiota bacterium]
MKKKLELQTIIVLLIVLGIAGSWIGIQITKDSLGVWSESAELHFTTQDLLGLGPRSALQCAGTAIGHVRKVTPSLGPDGAAHFVIVAGVKREFAAWKFAPIGTVKPGVVQSALAPSAISLDLSTAPEAAQPRQPKDGTPPMLKLEKEKSKNELADVARQYRELGDRIDATIRHFTDPKNGRQKSVMQELAESLPAASSALLKFDDVMASLGGQSRSTETDPAKRPPLDRLLLNLDGSTGHLNAMTASLEKAVGEDGKLDHTLATLNANLLRLQTLTDEMTKTVTNLNLKVDSSLRKVNDLLDETTGTMGTMHRKVEGLGDTFVGRMLIKKKEPTPTPAPQKTGRKPS